MLRSGSGTSPVGPTSSKVPSSPRARRCSTTSSPSPTGSSPRSRRGTARSSRWHSRWRPRSAAGNAVVLKPSELAPFSTLALRPGVPGGRRSPGCAERRHRRRRGRAGTVRPSARRQDQLHRRRGRRPRGVAGRRRAPHPGGTGARWQVGVHRVRRRRPRSRGQARGPLRCHPEQRARLLPPDPAARRAPDPRRCRRRCGGRGGRGPSR